jgi:hypothetical protein
MLSGLKSAIVAKQSEAAKKGTSSKKWKTRGEVAQERVEPVREEGDVTKKRRTDGMALYQTEGEGGDHDLFVLFSKTQLQNVMLLL